MLGGCLLTASLAWGRAWTTPINDAFRGYRQAGDWLAAHTSPDARVLDLKGWGLFYGGREGYSFANLSGVLQDRELGWVVANDALLVGPWPYCELLRSVVGDRPPTRSFPERRRPGVARVHIFDLAPVTARAGGAAANPTRR
jgi:hypothetical protein